MRIFCTPNLASQTMITREYYNTEVIKLIFFHRNCSVYFDKINTILLFTQRKSNTFFANIIYFDINDYYYYFFFTSSSYQICHRFMKHNDKNYNTLYFTKYIGRYLNRYPFVIWWGTTF